jgi:hypothetical protein
LLCFDAQGRGVLRHLLSRIGVQAIPDTRATKKSHRRGAPGLNDSNSVAARRPGGDATHRVAALAADGLNQSASQQPTTLMTTAQFLPRS